MLELAAPPGYAHRPVAYGPYSASRLTAARCPYRFFGQYVRGDRAVTSSVNAARGSAIHHVLASITVTLRDGAKVTPAMLNNWVAGAIALFPAAYDQVDLVRGAANAYLSNPSPYLNSSTSCETALAVALYEEQSFVDDIVPGRRYVAVDYATPDGLPNRGAFFGGRLDQVSVDEITKTVTIVDHKSTPNASKNEDHLFQLGCYAWLASLFWPPSKGYKIRTVLHYVHPALNFYAPPEYWSAEELQNFEGYIHDRIWAIEGFQAFPALPGTACEYCHLRQECPENVALMEQKARGQINMNVSSSADLVRLAGHVHVVSELKDELNKALKDGIELYAPEGGISINGVTYKFKPGDETVDWVATDLRIREEHNKAKQLLVSPELLSPEEKALRQSQANFPDLAAVLKHWGVDPNTFREWESKKLKNLWRLDKPELLDMLKMYVVKDRSTRWGAYKN